MGGVGIAFRIWTRTFLLLQENSQAPQRSTLDENQGASLNMKPAFKHFVCSVTRLPGSTLSICLSSAWRGTWTHQLWRGVRSLAKSFRRACFHLLNHLMFQIQSRWSGLLWNMLTRTLKPGLASKAALPPRRSKPKMLWNLSNWIHSRPLRIEMEWSSARE